MHPPMFVRPLACEEKDQIERGLHSRHAFTLRRCQALLASAGGQRPPEIAKALGCAPQSVRNAIAAFSSRGLASLKPQSNRPKTAECSIPPAKWDQLRALIHQSPRLFGRPKSIWSLQMLAEVCHEQGIAPVKLSGTTMERTLRLMGVNWKRAKQWMTSPDPLYGMKKEQRSRLIRLAAEHPDWVLGFEDEAWWSRVTQPAVRSWTDGPPLRLQVLGSSPTDPDPEAICCYGILRGDTKKVMLRFVEGRPTSSLTIQFLAWAADTLRQEGKKALLMVWDGPSWHSCDSVTRWIRDHNRKAREANGVRIIACELPAASPWLNNIEPCWTHARRAIVEPDRKLTASEIIARVCAYFGCEALPLLKAKEDADVQSV